MAALLALLVMFGAGGFYLYKSFIAKQADKRQTPDFDDEDADEEDYLDDEEAEETEDRLHIRFWRDIPHPWKKVVGTVERQKHRNP